MASDGSGQSKCENCERRSCHMLESQRGARQFREAEFPWIYPYFFSHLLSVILSSVFFNSPIFRTDRRFIKPITCSLIKLRRFLLNVRAISAIRKVQKNTHSTVTFSMQLRRTYRCFSSQASSKQNGARF